MKRYEWIPGRLFYVLVLLALALVGNPVAFAQDAHQIQNVIATSNAISEEGEGPENTVNGSGLSANDEHSTKATDMWLAELDDVPVYIQFEFNGVYGLDEMWVWNYNTQFESILGFGVKDVAIEYSENGMDWTVLDDVQFAQASARADYAANTIVSLGGVSAKYIRLTIRSGWGVMGRFGLSEVQFLTGSEPEPPQDAGLITNVVATSNAISEEGEGPENTVNGSGLNANDEHSTKATDMWLAELDDEPVYIQYEFDSVYELQEMWVWNYNTQFELLLGFGVKEVMIEYSVNGTNWTILDDVQLAQATATADYAANTTVPLGGISAQYVRLTIRSGWGVMGRFGLSEVRFVTGSEPGPSQATDSIPNVVATSNAISEEGTGPENTVNGSGLNANGEHSTKATDMWLGQPDDEPVYIQFEFDAVYELQEMWVWNHNTMFESLLGFGAKDVTIEYSVNGANWTILDDVQLAQATATADYAANTIVPLGGISAQYIRLEIRSGWGPLGQFGLSEVRFLTGSEPQPPQDAGSISNVVATSNATSDEGAGPENTVNGSGLNANGEHSTKATDMWLAKLEGALVYIQYEFDGVYELDEMWVWNHNTMFESILGFGVKDATIESSEDGTNWTILDDVRFAQATAQADYTANTIVPLGGVSAQYIRLMIRSGWGRLGQAGLSEVRFFSNQN